MNPRAQAEAGHRQNYFLFGETAALLLEAFQMNQIHPHYLGKSPLLQANWSWVLIVSWNIYTATLRLVFDRITEEFGLVKLTCQKDHHSPPLVNVHPYTFPEITVDLQIKAITKSYFCLTWYNYPVYDWNLTSPLPRRRCKVLRCCLLFSFVIL